MENLMKLQIWRERAERYDELQESYTELHGMSQEWGQKLEAVRVFVEDCWLKGGVSMWVLERLDSILGTKHGKILEAEEEK